jgi:hypothetical protein
LSACDDAASVVTVLKAGRAATTGAKALRLSGNAMFLRIARESIVAVVARG